MERPIVRPNFRPNWIEWAMTGQHNGPRRERQKRRIFDTSARDITVWDGLVCMGSTESIRLTRPRPDESLSTPCPRHPRVHLPGRNMDYRVMPGDDVG